MAKKILIIDDEKNIRSLVSAFLEKKGYSTLTAKSGREGIEIAHKHMPDLILLDINMPKMDGFAVLEEIKKSSRTMPISVIVLSGRGDDESKIIASRSYSEYYITKPFDLEELNSKISQVLKIKF